MIRLALISMMIVLAVLAHSALASPTAGPLAVDPPASFAGPLPGTKPIRERTCRLPALVVKTMKARRKSSRLPSASSQRPSSMICRSRSLIVRLAFSISSNRTTHCGWSRIFDSSPPLPRT